ncbi:hypothetical protein J6590_061628 [Homalodisca vitripennis]|nr:hypothetical protein J6590_061628 [Homalodisca vitripennis]
MATPLTTHRTSRDPHRSICCMFRYKAQHDVAEEHRESRYNYGFVYVNQGRLTAAVPDGSYHEIPVYNWNIHTRIVTVVDARFPVDWFVFTGLLGKLKCSLLTSWPNKHSCLDCPEMAEMGIAHYQLEEKADFLAILNILD